MTAAPPPATPALDAAQLLLKAARLIAAEAPAEAPPVAAPPAVITRRPVRFLRAATVAPHGGYVPGDVAGFPAEVAGNLVRVGLASFDLDGPEPAAALAPHLAGQGEPLVRLRVLKAFGAYATDERAGFPRLQAEALIKAGFAAPDQATDVVGRTLAVARKAVRR